MKRFLVLSVLLAISAEASAQGPLEQPGDEFRITVFHATESKGDGSSSSSRGGHEYIERVVAVREGGVERIFDLPLDPADEQRLISWQFPVHVFESLDGSMHLLNGEEMAARRDAWLRAAEIPSEACGSWYFTWNAFQVECEPEAVLDTLRSIEIQPPSLADGELFHHAGALKPGRLSVQGSSAAGQTFKVEMAVDPDFVHQAEARSDVIVGEIMKEPVSFEDAYAQRKQEQITGVIEVMLEVGPDGRVRRRVTTTEIQKVEVDGRTERQISTEEVERRAISDNTS